MTKRNPAFYILLFLGLMFASTMLSSASASQDVTAVATASQTTPPPEMLTLINTLRGLAVILLLIILVGAGMAAAWGNTKLASIVALCAVVLFGGFWVVALIAESFQEPPTIPTLAEFTEVPDSSGTEAPNGPAGPVKTALNAGLTILTSITLPFIMIYGLWLSIAVAAGESDAAVMRGYIIGACVALAASVLAQIFKVL